MTIFRMHLQHLRAFRIDLISCKSYVIGIKESLVLATIHVASLLAQKSLRIPLLNLAGGI